MSIFGTPWKLIGSTSREWEQIKDVDGNILIDEIGFELGSVIVKAVNSDAAKLAEKTANAQKLAGELLDANMAWAAKCEEVDALQANLKAADTRVDPQRDRLVEALEQTYLLCADGYMPESLEALDRAFRKPQILEEARAVMAEEAKRHD
jgi:hypothetical protein